MPPSAVSQRAEAAAECDLHRACVALQEQIHSSVRALRNQRAQPKSVERNGLNAVFVHCAVCLLGSCFISLLCACSDIRLANILFSEEHGWFLGDTEAGGIEGNASPFSAVAQAAVIAEEAAASGDELSQWVSAVPAAEYAKWTAKSDMCMLGCMLKGLAIARCEWVPRVIVGLTAMEPDRRLSASDVLTEFCQ